MRTDPSDPEVGRYEYVVRDIDDREPDLGIQDWNGPEMSLKARGFGELKTAASDEIEDRLDLEDYVGEHIATVYIDVDAWEYCIDWQIDRSLLQRIGHALSEVRR
ncbi:hypothetical protein [Salinibaculum salinum]|uniref:hypothetical protein n=1 Tax=Salinibaculum salinum TaxID=3131996 RepID=UPI0030EDD960